MKFRNPAFSLKMLVAAAVFTALFACGTGQSLATYSATRHSPKKPQSSSCSSPAPANNPNGFWPLDTNSFQGVFQFTGQAATKNAQNPNISGANLEWSWADIEPVEGQYNWSKVDRDISVWTSRGKSVILRFATAGQLTWSGTVDGSYTPPWVFNTYGVPRITETNGTVFPEYWSQVYLQKLADFVNAAAARYDNNPLVAAVEIGVGQGGETEPDGASDNSSKELQLWEQYGYSNALWWQTLQKIVGIYEAAWTHTPLTLMVTSTFLKYDDPVYNRALVEKYAVSQGLWLQINSLDNSMAASILNNANQLTTTVEEQKQAAAKSGYPALDDVEHGIALGARYVLVFADDLSNPANANALTYAVQHIATPVMPDCSGDNLTLTVSGRVTPVPGASGQPNTYAQFFDGSTGTASAPQAPLTNAATWSMEAWLYPTVLPQTGAVAVMNGADGNGGGFGIGISGANGGAGSKLMAYLPGVGWVDSGYAFPAARQWYDVIVTRDGHTMRFYVNGQQTPITSTLVPGSVSKHFSIGSGYNLSQGAPDHFFTGAIDNVATYASALSQSQARSHYSARYQQKNAKRK